MPSSPARADSMTTGTPTVTRVGLQGGEQLEAVHPRHHHVGQHQVGRQRPGPARARRRRPRRSARGSRRRAARRRTPGCRRCRRRPGSAGGPDAGVAGRHSTGRRRPARVQCVASARKPSATAATAADVVRRAARRAGRRAGARSPKGSRTVNVRALGPARCSPSPGRRAGATSSATSARPMPEPSWVRDRAPETRWKRSKRCGTSCSGMPVPVSVTVSSAPPSPRPRSAHRDPALEGELQGVREQVQHDLGPEVPVDVHRLRAAAGSRRSASRPSRSAAVSNMLASSRV